MSPVHSGLANADLILFDLDGTLVDSVPDITNAVNDMLENLQLPSVTLAQVRDWIGNGARVLVERALMHSLDEHIIENENYCETAYAAFLEAYHTRNGEHTALYPYVTELLDSYAHVKKAIITNKPEAHTRILLKKLNIEHCFALVTGGDTYPEQKPSSLPVTRTVEKAQAQSAVLIGDSINDILAARNAGIPVIGVSYGYNHGRPIQDENPDWVVDSLAELL